MDPLTAQQRSALMAGVRGKHTRPELAVRRLVWSLGFRYRLHGKDLPGKPDLVFRKRKKAIFVHGCFWHCHAGCRGFRLPATRQDYWLPKLAANRRRDERHAAALAEAGWRTLVVWECELRRPEEAGKKIAAFLSEPGNQATAKAGTAARRGSSKPAARCRTTGTATPSPSR